MTTSQTGRPVRPGRTTGLFAAAALAAVVLAYGQARAQTPGSDLATNYSANADKPIDIVADALEVDDKKKVAVFKGNVSATQGTFNIRATELQVKYASKADAADKPGAQEPPAAPVAGLSPGGGADITQIDAKGKVVVTTQNDQTAKSDWAVFEVKKQLVTIGGSEVVLAQGPNVIKGTRLIIDLKSGLSRFETGGGVASNGDKPRERLRAIFTPKSRPKATN